MDVNAQCSALSTLNALPWRRQLKCSEASVGAGGRRFDGGTFRTNVEATEIWVWDGD